MIIIFIINECTSCGLKYYIPQSCIFSFKFNFSVQKPLGFLEYFNSIEYLDSANKPTRLGSNSVLA